MNRIDPLGLLTLEQIEELKKQIELIQKMRDLAAQMIDNFENCKPMCLGVSSPVAHYCNCFRDAAGNCEDFAQCICIQIPKDDQCKRRAKKACEAAKKTIEIFKKAQENEEANLRSFAESRM